MKDFKCCATCENFIILKDNRTVKYFCGRLNFETKPKYKFDCWDPKDNIKKMLK
jgi:hypothetical protein